MSSTCPHDPKEFLGQPIGMYHCPVCGEMVIAGLEHPDYDLLTTEPDPRRIEELITIILRVQYSPDRREQVGLAEYTKQLIQAVRELRDAKSEIAWNIDMNNGRPPNGEAIAAMYAREEAAQDRLRALVPDKGGK